MRPRIQIIGEVEPKYVAFAVRKYNELQRQRENMGVNILGRKFFAADGTRVEMTAMTGGFGEVRLSGLRLPDLWVVARDTTTSDPAQFWLVKGGRAKTRVPIPDTLDGSANLLTSGAPFAVDGDHILCTGMTKADTTHVFYLAKIDLTGKILWKINYISGTNTDTGYPSNVQITDDAVWVFHSYTAIPAGTYDGAAYKFSRTSGIEPAVLLDTVHPATVLGAGESEYLYEFDVDKDFIYARTFWEPASYSENRTYNIVRFDHTGVFQDRTLVFTGRPGTLPPAGPYRETRATSFDVAGITWVYANDLGFNQPTSTGEDVKVFLAQVQGPGAIKSGQKHDMGDSTAAQDAFCVSPNRAWGVSTFCRYPDPASSVMNGQILYWDLKAGGLFKKAVRFDNYELSHPQFTHR